MNINKLFDKDSHYFFPELLPYLRDDLLPGLGELMAYSESFCNAPDFHYGLTSRIHALRDDLMNALAGIHAGHTGVDLGE